MAKKIPAWMAKINREIDCICGLCFHKINSTACLYTRIRDAEDPDVRTKKEINRMINEVISNDRKDRAIDTKKKV